MEYECVTKELHGRIDDILKIVSLGLAILGVGLSVGLSQNQYKILLLLPLAYFGVLLFYVYTIRNLFLLGGYKKFLSDKINSLLGDRVLVWENISKKEVHLNVNRIFLELVFLFTGILTVWASVDTAACYLDCRWVTIVAAGNAVLSLGLVLSVVDAIRIRKSSYEFAAKSA